MRAIRARELWASGTEKYPSHLNRVMPALGTERLEQSRFPHREATMHANGEGGDAYALSASDWPQRLMRESPSGPVASNVRPADQANDAK